MNPKRRYRAHGALVFQGQWIKLTGPQGVFKPKELRDGPLTLLSALASRYEGSR